MKYQKVTRRDLGYFEATSFDGTPERVIISQEIRVNEENVIVESRKVFSLGTVDGEEISPVTDSQTFRRKDGTLLKKNGCCRVGGSRVVS